MRAIRAHHRRGFIDRAVHFGREFGRHTDAFFRVAGPSLKQLAMNIAPALAASGMPQAAALTAVAGQAADGYSQLRNALPE